MQLIEIGQVVSAVQQPTDEGWGNVSCKIELQPQWAAGLQGLESFSHLWVVFWMHQSTFDAGHLQRRPQDRAELPLVGIFAQRAKHRPNPIGITAVKLLSIEPTALWVQGLDAIHGTPVLDIKPYFTQFDRVEHSQQPAWVNQLMQHYF